MIVGISIVNYKTADLTIKCLQSLVSERELINFEVIIVDNDSRDGSFEKISTAVASKGWSDWVQVIDSGHNGGFSFGNNIAIRQFFERKELPEFIYLLNPDTYIFPNAVNKLATFMQQNPKAGILGGRIEEPDGTPQSSSFKFHTWITELDRGFSFAPITKILTSWVDLHQIAEHAEKTDWVSGASMMIRREVFEQIGLLDEAYFMYFEETDFCLHATRANWECWYVPESRVVHYFGQSTGITNNGAVTKKMPNYWFDSRRRYFLKNYGVIHAVLADIFWLIGFSTWKIRNCFQKKPHIHPPHLLKDSFINSIFNRGIKVLPVKNKF